MYLVSFSIYFKHRNIFVSVDFIPWWMSPYTFCLQKLKKEFFRILFNSQILQFFFPKKKKKPKKTPLSQSVSPIWYTHLHIYVTLTMCLLRIVEVFMYLRQNSHRYILGKRAYSSGYGLEYHVDISKRPISSFLILYSCRSFLE